MSEPFLAEIKIMGFNYAPRGWAECNGQILPINQNQSLFSLLGSTYGGDARTTFGLPDLRGRTPIHTGAGYSHGQVGGEEIHTLTPNEIPAHTHDVRVSDNNANLVSPALPDTFGQGKEASYAPYANSQRVNMAQSMVSNTPGQAHNNMQPFMTLNFCIALQGLFPSRN